MLYRTTGIIFHTIPYSDSRVIAKIYTRKSGLQSFIITISRSKSGKIKAPLLQPLTQLELSVDVKEKSHLHCVREMNLAVPYSGIHTDIVKTSVALFVAELLYKSIREEEQNEQLYDFIGKSVQVLDLMHEGVANFHLVFMVNLTRYLGFYPTDNDAGPGSVFDLVNGTFVNGVPSHFNYLDKEESRLLESVSRTSFENIHNLMLNSEKRKIVLNALIRYYEFHIPAMQKIQSHEILSTVLL